MATPNEFGQLNSQQWRELQDCASRLEQTLRDNGRPSDLLRFLPAPDAPHRRAVLHELIKTELEALYRSNHGQPLEEYLDQYQELGNRDDLPASLIYEEYRVRSLYGDRPRLERYQERFPRQYEELCALALDKPLPTTYGTARPAPRAGSSVPATGEAPKAPFTTPGGSSRTPHDVAPTHPLGETKKKDSVEIPPLGDLRGFEKTEPLGRGEFGEVWKALAPGGVEVALKFVLRTLDHDATRRELKALEKIRKLHHPFLLQTHSYGMMDGRLTIVMELADGSLSERYKECKDKGMQGIPVVELVPYFREAAEALDYLHEQHVSHRDIKPQNLLMLHGYAKVADFGLAREQEHTVAEASVVCGTPYYMAPEVWQQQLSRHSDQYSLAATYAEMRLGRRLFAGKNPFEIAESHMRKTPELEPLPPAEQQVLLKALAKEPEARYPTCSAFAQALTEATAPPPAAPAESHVKAIVTTLAVVLTLSLLGLWIWLSRPHDTGSVPPSPEQERVDWPPPPGWSADGAEMVTDMQGRRFYKRFARMVGPQKVMMLAVPQTRSVDPPTFYIMEDKVWNDLFAVFDGNPKAKELQQIYGTGGGRESLFRNQWRKGGRAPAMPDMDLGVEGKWSRVPVFNVTATEAHCFAEWLGGRLPTKKQWLKAAGADGDDPRAGPFDGDTKNIEDLAVQQGDGPWPVDKGKRDASINGCRQMASNGKEWTRNLAAETADGDKEIPLSKMLDVPNVVIVGQSYAARAPLVFKKMRDELDVKPATAAEPDVGFRVVLER